MSDLSLKCPHCHRVETDANRFMFNGPGFLSGQIRVSFWCLGCKHLIKYCFNPEHPRYDDFLEKLDAEN